MKKYKEQLRKLIEEKRHSWSNLLKSAYKHILDDMLANVPKVFLGQKAATLAYCYLNDVEALPKCKICGKELSDLRADPFNGFNGTCGSKECVSKYRYAQTKKAVLEKYGVANVYALKSTHDKAAATKHARYGFSTYNNAEKNKATCLEKYGVDNPAKAEEFKEKSKQTCLEKYGVEYSLQAEEVREKIKKSSLEKYGVENPGGSVQSVQKIKAVLTAKYGPDVCSPGDLLRELQYTEKSRQTCIERYGVAHPAQSEEVKAKHKTACLEKYGCSNYMTYLSYKILEDCEYDRPLFSLAEYDAKAKDFSLKFQCCKCGSEFTAEIHDGKHRHCPKCYPTDRFGTSLDEIELYDFIKSISQDAVHNDRSLIKPFELDVYIPAKKLAFEYDGLYYHQYGAKDKRYHLTKTEMCASHGVQLIHVFESDWKLKPGIVKSRIKNLLGRFDHVVYARKCEIKAVSSKDSAAFQNANHIQGAVGAAVHLGLYHDGELVSLMTFGKCRFSKHYDWELLRFCSKLGYHIPGGASRLLKRFEREYSPKSLVSYADRRWSAGKLYEALGFRLDHASGPNYWYFKNGSCLLESRVKYQKHKLEKLLEKFDPAKPETLNMAENGYGVIYDCGNLVYAKDYS